MVLKAIERQQVEGHSDQTSRTSKKTRQAVTRELLRVVDSDVLTYDVLSGLAGDRRLSAREEGIVNRLRKKRGEAFYSDVLLELSHQHFAPDMAHRIWCGILLNKSKLNDKLGRNVGLSVAALDFLRNKVGLLKEPTIIAASKRDRVVDVALKDGLTALFDHATFNVRLSNELQRYSRYGDGFGLMMLDVDNFKQINDTQGHGYGDEVLKAVGLIIMETIRDTDTGARYGGEEFVVLTPRTSIEKSLGLAERLRANIEREFALWRHPVTVSIGVAGCPPSDARAERLLVAADRALYRAKRQGKNRVIVAPRTGLGS